MNGSTAPIVEVRRLSRRFGGLAAIDNLNFVVPRGAIKAVIGPNGAGKTTLFNLLSGVLPPSDGEIWFDGGRIDELAAYQRVRLGVTRTFQNLQIFDRMTVCENVMVGRHVRGVTGLAGAILRSPGARAEERAIRDAACEALAAVGLSGRADDLATSLSFGERKLLEIARALASEPRLLLLDEPAAGLGSTDIGRIGDLIVRLNARGVTVLLVEHNMRLVMNISHDILVLNFGQKIAEGTADAVRGNPDVVEAYLGQEDDDVAD